MSMNHGLCALLLVSSRQLPMNHLQPTMKNLFFQGRCINRRVSNLGTMKVTSQDGDSKHQTEHAVTVLARTPDLPTPPPPPEWKTDGPGRTPFREYRPNPAAAEKPPPPLQQPVFPFEIPISGDLLLIVPAAVIAVLGVLTTLLIIWQTTPLFDQTTGREQVEAVVRIVQKQSSLE